MKEINVNGQKRTDLGKKPLNSFAKKDSYPVICMVRRKMRTDFP